MNDVNMLIGTDDISPHDLAEKLPDYPNYWTIEYNKETELTYQKFYEEVNATQLEGDPQPYRFGTYQIYQADRDLNRFQVNVFVNATSQESVPYFQQYMY